MYLQDHTTTEPPLTDRFVQADHGDLDEVGGRALQRGIDGIALGIASDDGIGAIDVRQEATAVEERRHVTLLLSGLDDLRHVASHPRIGGKVAVDKLFGLLAGDREPFAEPKGRDPVDDTEVGGLGPTAHVGRDLF